MPRRPLALILGPLPLAATSAAAQAPGPLAPMPMDISAGSITAEDVPYPYPVSYLPLTRSAGRRTNSPGRRPSFRERMAFVAKTIPGGKGQLLLLPRLGHVPHLEAPGQTFPPLVAFLKAGLR